MKNLLTITLFLFLSHLIVAVPSAEEKSQGEETYQKFCAPCHASGMAGAPAVGDKEDWGLRIWQGMNALIQHSIQGYKGNKGDMPARGGHSALSDAEVISAVEYMVSHSR